MLCRCGASQSETPFGRASFFLAERRKKMGFNKRKVNDFFSDIYDQCSKKAKSICLEGTDQDIEFLRKKYGEEQNRYGSSHYPEERYVERMICARELVKRLKLNKDVKWTSFKSPIEVYGYFALNYSWSRKLISINKMDPTGRYEVDLAPCDIYGNCLFLLDLQGEHHREGHQKKKDEKKKEYFKEQGIKFVQINGVDIKNQFHENITLLSDVLEEVLAGVNVRYLCSHKKITKNKMVYRLKP
jgi:very-short-patch-repair endonuclease